jgi:hypothetical protein
MFKDGSTSTTQIGYVNRNNQLILGTRGVKGTARIVRVEEKVLIINMDF